MFNNMWDVKEPKHYSKRVGREVPGAVAVLCVVNTGPMLIAVTTITEMVILYKYVEIIIIIIIITFLLSLRVQSPLIAQLALIDERWLYLQDKSYLIFENKEFNVGG